LPLLAITRRFVASVGFRIVTVPTVDEGLAARIRAGVASWLETRSEMRAIDATEVAVERGAVRVTQRFRADASIIHFAAELVRGGASRFTYGVVYIRAEPALRRSWAALPVIGGVEPPEWPSIKAAAEAAFRAELPGLLDGVNAAAGD